MASRVNTKFVVILCTVLLVLVAAVVVLSSQVLNRSAAHYERKGDSLYAQGDLKRATEAYLHGIGRDPSNLALLNKYVDIASDMEMRDTLEATNTLRNIRGAIYQAANYHRDNTKQVQELFEYEYDLARKFGGASAYNRLYDLADNWLTDRPGDVIAQKYRGIAQANRMGPGMPADQVQQIEADLAAANAADPEDAEVLYHLAILKLKQAATFDRPGGDPAAAAKLRGEAYEVSKAMHAINPEDRDRALKHLAILLQPTIARQDQAVPIMGQLEAEVLETPEPLDDVVATAAAVAAIDTQLVAQEGGLPDTTRGRLRAMELVKRAADAHPDSLYHAVLLGMRWRAIGRIEEALEQFEKVRGMPAAGNPIQTLGAESRKQIATYQVGDLSVAMATRASGDERTAWLDRAELAADELQEMIRDSPELDKLRGKLLLNRGRIDEALQKLNRASEQFDDRDDETILLIADAANRRGEWGLAVRQIKSILARRPDQTQLRARLAGIYIRHRQLDEAKKLIDLIEANDPDFEQLPMLRAAYLGQLRQPAQAISIYETYDLDQNPRVVLPLVQAYAADGQTDKARALVNDRLAKDPADMRLLRLAIFLNPEQDDRLAIIERARAAGGDPAFLDLFAKQISGELTADEMVAFTSQQTDDPLEQALREARVLARAGRSEEARAAIERAAWIAPEDPRIVTLKFTQALADKDFDTAQALADEAARQNLDLANGAFFKARLQARQGQTRAAIESARQTLDARPVFPEGNRFLGVLFREYGQPDEAIEQFELALEYQPDNTQTLVALAAAYVSVGRNEDALEKMRQAYLASPNNAAVFNQYVAMEQAAGDSGRALDARFERAKRTPNDLLNRRTLAVQLAEQDRYPEAIAIVDELIEQEGGQGRDNVMTKASVERAAGNTDRGLALIKQYIESLGAQAQSEDLLLEARFQRLAGNSEGMITAFHRAIELEDKLTRPASREFGDVMFQLGQNETARTVYQELHASNPDDDAIRLRYAEALLRAGKTEESEALLAEVESSATTGLLKVMAALQRGDTDQALELIRQTLADTEERDTRSRALLHFQRGRVLADDREDFAGAIPDLQQAIELNPAMTPARILLANCLVAAGQPDQAKRELRTALELNPGDGRIRLRLVNLSLSDTDFAAARALLDEAIKSSPEDPVWPQIRAQLAERERHPGEAESNWRKALALRPTPQVIVSLAELLLKQDRPQEALAVLDSQSQVLAAQPVLQAMRGRALLATDATQAARQVFTHAIERCTTPAQLLQVSSQIVAAYDDADRAIAVLEAAQLPALSHALSLALAQIEVSDFRYESALSRIDQVMPRVPDEDALTRVALTRLKGVCLYQLDRVEEARGTYEQVLAMSANDTQTLNNYAFLLLEQELDLSRALELAEQATRQAPANGAVLDTLGWAQFKNGQTEEARLTLQRAVTLADLAASHYHLAVVLDQLARESDNRTLRASLRQRADQSLEQALRRAKQEGDKRYIERSEQLMDQWKNS